MSMKVLIGLNALQTIAIVVLIVMVGGNHAALQQQSAGADIASPQFQTSSADSANPSLGFADEARLRSIIREELASQTPAAIQDQEGEAKASTPDLQSAAHMRNQSQLVAQKIEGYKGVGVVTNHQMQELLNDIDQLDEPNRAQMMSSLARAINTGALKGRL